MDVGFRTLIEFIADEPSGLRFRLAFSGSSGRWLLHYPAVTGLRFVPPPPCPPPEWGTRSMVIEPRDEFVLRCGDRIAFDLVAPVNVAPSDGIRWAIRLPAGAYDVRHEYSIAAGEARYDFLNKGSRFADSTPPWTGTVVSNTIRVTVSDKGRG